MRDVAIGIFLLVLSTGCATEPRRTISAPPRRPGHVYMFRGLIGPIATGVDAFSRELRTKGFDAHAYEDVLGHFVAAKIERDYAGAAKGEPLVLVGYSSGAVTAVAIARRLNRLHIPVDLLVTLDPTVSEVVPSNVRACLNYYERTVPGVILLSGTMMRAGAGVNLENIRLAEPNHFTIDESPVMKTAVTALIAELSSAEHNSDPRMAGRPKARVTQTPHPSL
jgi:thioesterase domain-containing protein